MSNEKIGFNPEDFGFEEYEPRTRQYGGEKSYLLRNAKEGRKSGQMRLVLSGEDTEFARELLGNTVNMYVNDKGYLLLTEGKSLKLSRQKTKCDHATVSCCGLSRKIVGCYGEFRRLYLSTTMYGNGNALLFKPSGERD